jgi:glyoxylase-like metal-dependent hydrolase (beta-lactamase superfamily II)
MRLVGVIALSLFSHLQPSNQPNLTSQIDISKSMEPTVHTIIEPVTGTWQYIVADPDTKDAVIIDSVLNYDKEAGKLSTDSADQILQLVEENGYKVDYILETHAHADHLTASRYLQNKLSPRPKVGIGKGISQVQETMGKIYDIPAEEMEGAFDQTFADGEKFNIGKMEASIVHLPGHTPDHIGYVIGPNVFTGDSMFNPDVGSARCDFPGGSATDLFNSMQKLLNFPPHFKMYVGHDYPPKERGETGHVPYTTVEEQARENKHVKSGTQMDDFVKWRSERDATLNEPKLLKQSMHVNVRGGRLPAKPVDGFKIESVPAHVPTAA